MKLLFGHRRPAGESAAESETGANKAPVGGSKVEDEIEDEEDDYDEENALDAVMERVLTWGNEWAQSDLFEALTDEQKSESRLIIETFTEYMFEYYDSPPEEWTPYGVTACCVETLPEKVSAEEPFYRALAPVLASFITYLGRTGQILKSQSRQLVARVERLGPDIVQAAADPRNWGMAKSLVMAAYGAGVDPTNDVEMNRFVEQYNKGLLGGAPSGPPLFRSLPPGPPLPDMAPQVVEPYVRSSPKVGRNEPCPCGSGKKYKRCCGA